MRGAKKIDLKKIADSGCTSAFEQGHTVEHVLVCANEDAQSQADTPMVEGRDVFWQQAIPQQPDTAGGWVAGHLQQLFVACWLPQCWQTACFQILEVICGAAWRAWHACAWAYLTCLLELIQRLPISPMAAEVEWMDSEDTLFYLYTSGSTGKPKGVVHTIGGFMVSCTAGASWARLVGFNAARDSSLLFFVCVAFPNEACRCMPPPPPSTCSPCSPATSTGAPQTAGGSQVGARY
jgi:hypothetical protein